MRSKSFTLSAGSYRFRLSRKATERRKPQRSTNGASQPAWPYRPCRYLLSKTEFAFFQVLSEICRNEYHISCKVRLADVITCKKGLWTKGPGSLIAQKHLDFVLTDPRTSRIVAAIELDDRTHDRPARQKRDAFVNLLCRRAGLPLIRMPARFEYDAGEIADALSALSRRSD